MREATTKFPRKHEGSIGGVGTAERWSSEIQESTWSAEGREMRRKGDSLESRIGTE